MALLTENPVLLRNDWLRFRHLSEHDDSTCFPDGVSRLPNFLRGKLVFLLDLGVFQKLGMRFEGPYNRPKIIRNI